ncbi:cytokine receptor common subunit beta-like [Rhinoraja longicauda]
MFAEGGAGYLGIYSALVLSLVHQTEEVQDTMSNLSCHTDYETKIDCQWTENAEAMRYVPIDLYYQKKSATSNPSHRLCNRTEPPTAAPSTKKHCTIKANDFAVGIDYLLIFKPRKPVNLRKSFNLSENIKLQAPFNLMVDVTEAGNYKLSWETRYMDNSSDELLGTLQHEVNYKQSWESWEDSSSETVAGGSRHLEIRGSGLVSVGTYAARVRVRPQRCSSRCMWSAWSPVVPWSVRRSQPGSQAAETEVMPQNLQCSYDRLQEIKCTWEVTRMSSDLFTFNLHYGKANSSETQVCNSSVRLREYPNVTVHGCNIHVRDREEFEQFEVSLNLVQPQPMPFNPFRNIKPDPPDNLTVEKLPDGRFQLQWESNKFTYDLEYQVNYKKVDQSWENKMWQIPSGNKKFTVPKNSLDPSSRYMVRMQAKVICQGGSKWCYRGVWSEWSQSVDFTTDPDKESFIIVACCLLILFIIITPITALVIKRKKRMWLDSIPDPAKSQLFHMGEQRGALIPMATLEMASVEEGSICKVVTADSLTTPPHIIPRVKTKYPVQKQGQGHSSPPVSSEGDGPERIYQGFKRESGEVSRANRASPTAPSDYNGPYMFNFQHVPSLLSEFSQSKAATGEGPGPAGYVKLPPGGGAEGAGQCRHAPMALAAYVPNPPAPSSDYIYAAAQQPGRPSHYVLSMPPTNSTPVPVVGPDRQAPPSQWVPDPRPYVVGLQSAAPAHGVDDPLSGGKDVGVTSPGNVSPDHPTAAPLSAVCGGYVRTPTAEAPSPFARQDPRLPGDTRLGEWPQPPTSKTDAHQPPPRMLSSFAKPRVGPQKPAAKEAEPPCVDTVNDGASEVILYQPGAKPILFQQIGDYCFLPGAIPTKRSESTKGLVVSAAKTEPANTSLDPLEKRPPLPHSPSPSHHIACS